MTNKLPKDRAEIEYSRSGNQVVTVIRQNCGCEWEIIWERSGKVAQNGISVLLFCSDHDPTIDDEGEIVNF